MPGEEHGLPQQSRALQRPRWQLLADFLEEFAQAQLRRVPGLRRLKLKKDLFPLPGCKCDLSLPVLEHLLPCSARRRTVPRVCVWANNYYYWGGQSPSLQFSLFFPFPKTPRFFLSVSPLLICKLLMPLRRPAPLPALSRSPAQAQRRWEAERGHRQQLCSPAGPATLSLLRPFRKRAHPPGHGAETARQVPAAFAPFPWIPGALWLSYLALGCYFSQGFFWGGCK